MRTTGSTTASAIAVAATATRASIKMEESEEEDGKGTLAVNTLLIAHVVTAVNEYKTLHTAYSVNYNQQTSITCKVLAAATISTSVPS
jgi:hypothetical protein